MRSPCSSSTHRW